MSKALKITLAVVSVLAAAFAVYWFSFRKDPNNIEAIPGTTDTTGETTSGTNTAQNSQIPLKKGSTGQLVTDVQKGLNTYFGANISIDGAFGPQTETALRGRGLPVILYWKEYSYISKKPILVNGVMQTIIKL